MWIKTKPGGGMKSLKGTMTCVPTDVVTTVKALPRNVNDVDIVHVELKKHKTVHLTSCCPESMALSSSR